MTFGSVHRNADRVRSDQNGIVVCDIDAVTVPD